MRWIEKSLKLCVSYRKKIRRKKMVKKNKIVILEVLYVFLPNILGIIEVN